MADKWNSDRSSFRKYGVRVVMRPNGDVGKSAFGGQRRIGTYLFQLILMEHWDEQVEDDIEAGGLDLERGAAGVRGGEGSSRAVVGLPLLVRAGSHGMVVPSRGEGGAEGEGHSLEQIGFEIYEESNSNRGVSSVGGNSRDSFTATEDETEDEDNSSRNKSEERPSPSSPVPARTAKPTSPQEPPKSAGGAPLARPQEQKTSKSGTNTMPPPPNFTAKLQYTKRNPQSLNSESVRVLWLLFWIWYGLWLLFWYVRLP